MTNAEAIRGAADDSTTSGHLLESLATACLFGVAAFTQLSIAIAQALLFI